MKTEMEFKIVGPKRELAIIKIKSKSDKYYQARRIQAGRGDWIYEIMETTDDHLTEIVCIGQVVIASPTNIIDFGSRKGEVSQVIGNKISEYEKPAITALC